MNQKVAIYCILCIFCVCNGQICPNSGKVCDRAAGQCCSTEGWCGVGDAWCGPGNTMFPLDDTDNGNTDCPQCPICPGENRTLSPTPPPSEKPVFQYHCPCKCWGDPHCQMWNCKVNNYQGPHNVDPAGSFYYITPCQGMGYDHSNMPFDFIGVHKRYDNYFTSLDYTILKLYDGKNVYCIKTKGNQAVSYNDDCSDNYDETVNEGETVKLGDNFEITWQRKNGAVELKMNVLNEEDSDCDGDPDLTVISTTATVKEEGMEVKLSDCYQKYTCGMCGTFRDEEYHFQRLDGSYMTLSEGCWGGTANKVDGLSYLVSGTMGRRRLQGTDTNLSEPCYGKLDDIETECGIEIDQYEECCASRLEFCEDMVIPNCKWDACSCVMNYDEAQVTDEVIEQCVEETISAAMNFTCMLPADDFIIPETLVVEEDESESECDEDNAGVNIIIGIAIGCAIFIVIDIVIYFVWIKPKLDAINNGYGVADTMSSNEQSAN